MSFTFLSCDDDYSHTLEPAEKRRKKSSLEMSLLKACSRILAHVEERCALRGLHLNFAKNEIAAQLNGLFTEDGIRGLLEGKNHYGVDMVFPFLVSSFDRSTGSEANGDLIATSMQCIDIVNKGLADHREVKWVQGKLTKLCPETEAFKRLFKEYLGRIAHLGSIP